MGFAERAIMTATTFDTNKLPATSSDNNVDLAVIDQSLLVLNENLSTRGNPLNSLAVYDYRTGDKTYPAQVKSRLSQDGPKVLVPSFQWTAAFATLQLATDGDSNISVDAPEEWGIYYKGPVRQRTTEARMMRGFHVVLGLTGPSIASGVLNTGRLTDVLYLDPYVY
jgi:hypothetical protein